MDGLFEKKEAIDICKLLLDEIISDMSKLASLYHQEDKKNAFKVTDVLLHKLTSLTANMKISGYFSIEDIKRIDPILAEMLHSFENLDYVLISDLLEYELLPLMNSWRKQIILKGASK